MAAQTWAGDRAARQDGGSPHVQEKRNRRRNQILHAALRAFRNKGYHATTLKDIAAEIGVRETALYHYFPDKHAILYECHRESLDELDRIMREADALETAREKLEHCIREHVRVMTVTLDGSPLAFEVTSLGTEQRDALIAGRDRYEGYLRQIIAAGMRTGEFHPGDPKLAVFVILGAINWIARWYRPEGTFHASELGDEFVQKLLHGLVAAARPLPARTLTKHRRKAIL